MLAPLIIRDKEFALPSNLRSSRPGGHSRNQEHAKHDIHIVVRNRINGNLVAKLPMIFVYIILFIKSTRVQSPHPCAGSH